MFAQPASGASDTFASLGGCSSRTLKNLRKLKSAAQVSQMLLLAPKSAAQVSQIRCTGVANADFGTKSAAQVSQIYCTGVANADLGTESAAKVSQMPILAPNPLHRRRKC